MALFGEDKKFQTLCFRHQHQEKILYQYLHQNIVFSVFSISRQKFQKNNIVKNPSNLQNITISTILN